MKNRNNMVKAKVFYGLHFQSGICAYPENEGEVLYIPNEVAKDADTSFAGCPVYAGHHIIATEETFKQSDGYVVESFFNQADGFHWCKFVVTSKEGLECIDKGYKLSNSYMLERKGEGGIHRQVEYTNRVDSLKYNHLALVEHPRYEESIILTPEEFKKYNEDKIRATEAKRNSLSKKNNKKSQGAKMKTLNDIITNGKENLYNGDEEIKLSEVGDLKVNVGGMDMPVKRAIEILNDIIDNEKEKMKNKKKKNMDDDEKENMDEDHENEGHDDKDNDDDEKENMDDDEKKNKKRKNKKKRNMDKDKDNDDDDDDDEVGNESDDDKKNSLEFKRKRGMGGSNEEVPTLKTNTLIEGKKAVKMFGRSILHGGK